MSAGARSRELRTCPHCGELTHLHLCKPAIASMLADEWVAHAADLRSLALLQHENDVLRQQLEEERRHP